MRASLAPPDRLADRAPPLADRVPPLVEREPPLGCEDRLRELPLEREDALRDDELFEDELREDVLREDEPPVDRREPPLRDDDPELAPELDLEPPLREPLLLA